MTTTRADIVLQHIRGLAAEPSAGGDDRRLLERFTADGDEAAFAELIRRHGAMVLGVCRRVLGDANAAEDAFQATFLVLARSARSIRRGESLGGWLYQVAFKTALKARARAAAQVRRERRAGTRPPVGPLDELTGRELLVILDEELARLPRRHRAPLVLCYLEGKTRDEAAHELGWPLGTLKHRLEAARARLRARLEGRGLGLPAALLTAGAVTTAVPSALAASTAEAARAVASGDVNTIPSRVAALLDATAPTTGRQKVVAVVLALSLFGVGLLWRGDPESRPPPAKEAHKQDTAAKAANDPGPTEKPEAKVRRVRLTGRVLDHDGRPVATAEVAAWVYDRSWVLDKTWVPAGGKTDVEGQYRLEVAVPMGEPYTVHLRAAARGHGFGEVGIDSRNPKPDGTIKLVAEHVSHGRLVSLEGAIAAGVRLRVRSGSAFPEGDPWPGPITTDDRGRFTVRGLGKGAPVALEVDDERFARQYLPFAVGAGKSGEEPTFTLAPLRVLEGTVTAEDTGKPIPSARVVVAVPGLNGVEARTDERGRYRLIPYSDVYLPLVVFPPEGVPYVPWRVEKLSWPAALVKRTVDVKLPRGVLVRGKVTEAGTGKPVAGARVGFRPRLRDNPAYRKEVVHYSGSSFRGRVGLAAQLNEQLTGADGTFRLAVLPGPGHLVVKAESQDFVDIETSYIELESGKPGRYRYYPDAIVPFDAGSETTPAEVVVVLRRGVTLTGRIVGPDGKPAGNGELFARGFYSIGRPLFFQANPFPPGDTVFELPGRDPEKAYKVVVFDRAGPFGGVAEVSAKQAKEEPITIRLGRCGSATVRFVDDKGKPWANHSVGYGPLVAQLYVVLTPGRMLPEGMVDEDESLRSDMVWMRNLGGEQYDSLRTDADGRVTFPTLIPGATIALWLGYGKAPQELTVKPGENVKLLDVVVKREAE